MKDRPDELPPSRLLGQEEATPTMEELEKLLTSIPTMQLTEEQRAALQKEAANAKVTWKAHPHIINDRGTVLFSFSACVSPPQKGKMIYTDDMKIPMEDGD